MGWLMIGGGVLALVWEAYWLKFPGKNDNVELSPAVITGGTVMIIVGITLVTGYLDLSEV